MTSAADALGTSPTELDGRVASQQELDRARAIATLLEAIAADPLVEGGARLHDLAEVLLYPLRDGVAALAAVRRAQTLGRTYGLARTHRRAAIQTRSDDEVLLALESEARLATTPVQRAALESHRGVLLELVVGSEGAAKRAFETALEQDAGSVDAQLGLVRLALRENDPGAASKHVMAVAAVCEQASVRAELMLFAARLAEKAGRLDEARGIAAQASTHDKNLAAALFFHERQHGGVDDARAACEQMKASIEAGLLEPADGWLEIGLLAKYALSDQALAEQAFEAVSAGAGVAARSARAELVEIWAARGRVDDAVRVATELAMSAEGPLDKAIAFTEVGRLYESLPDEAEHVEAAAQSYRSAIEAVPSYLPALEGAGRTHGRLNDRERQVWAHVSEAEQAVSPMDRAVALRRAAELLLRDDANGDEGLALLEQAWAAAPGHEGIFSLLERVLRRRGAWPRLRVLYEEELARPLAPARRARLLMRLGPLCTEQLADPARAVAAYQEVAGLSASVRDLALAELERVFEDVGDLPALEDALANLSTSTTDPVQLASLEERLAELRDAQGDAKGALELYRRAIERAPNTHSVLASAGRAFGRAKDWPSLLALYDRTVRDGSTTERVTYGYKAAMLQAFQLGDVPGGIARLEAVLADSPRHAPTLVALSTLYTRAKRWSELFTVSAALPATPVQRVRRAVIAELAGLHEQALEIWSTLEREGVGASRPARARLLGKLGRWAELAQTYQQAAQDGPPARAAHARYRAAELWAERCSERGRALALTDGLAPATAFVLAWGHGRGEAMVELTQIAESLPEAGLRAALLGELAVMHRGGAEADDAMQRWSKAAPQNPAASLYEDERCEAMGDRAGLIERLRQRLRTSDGDEETQARSSARLATLLQEVGGGREAIDALERAAASPFVPVPALLDLTRLYAELGDIPRLQTALQALAEALPEGSARALCLRALAHSYLLVGDRERAAAMLEWALRTDACDFTALRSLAALVETTEPMRMIAPLVRAWESEPAGPQRVQIGVAVAVRMLRVGRYDNARDCLHRVLADAPEHFGALLTSAELEQRAQRWSEAATYLERIADHSEAEPTTVREAMEKLVELQLGPLQNPQAARASSAKLCAITDNDIGALTLALRAAEAAGAIDDTESLLRRLIESPQVTEDARAGHQLALASQLDSHRNDSLAAIDVLSNIRLPSRRREAIERLMALGEKTNRWDLAAAALEQTLDRHVDDSARLDSAWEVAIRTRLAELLDGPLERQEAAARQYERIVALDPKQLPALLRLAELVAAEPDKAIVHQRALLVADPSRLVTYRTLRGLALTTNDEDTAFLVEAVLEGAGIADEEETYFYQQRRGRLGPTLEAGLQVADLDLLAPERALPALRLLATVASALAQVFPIDLAYYGITESAVADSPLSARVGGIANVLGMGSFRLDLVSNRVGACAEVGVPPRLLAPRSLEEAPPREQMFLLGEIAARAAFGFAIGDPRRANAITPTLLEYVVWACFELSSSDGSSPFRGKAVYEDIRRRLSATVSAEEKTEASAIVAAQGSNRDVNGAELLAAMNAAAFRAGAFMGHDPAVALASSRQREGITASGIDALPEGVRAVLPFLLSSQHLELRRRLGMGVR